MENQTVCWGNYSRTLAEKCSPRVCSAQNKTLVFPLPSNRASKLSSEFWKFVLKAQGSAIVFGPPGRADCSMARAWIANLLDNFVGLLDRCPRMLKKLAKVKARSRSFSASVHEYPYGQIHWWAKTPAGGISLTETMGYNSRNIYWHALGASQKITSPLYLNEVFVKGMQRIPPHRKRAQRVNLWRIIERGARAFPEGRSRTPYLYHSSLLDEIARSWHWSWWRCVRFEEKILDDPRRAYCGFAPGNSSARPTGPTYCMRVISRADSFSCSSLLR